MWFRSAKKIDVAALRQSALSVLVQAGTLRECEHHKGSYIQGTCDLAAAYTVANAEFTKGTFGPMSSEFRNGLIDAIKKAYGENMFFDRCEKCRGS